MIKHLSITMHMDRCPISIVLVDKGVALNVMPITLLKYWVIMRKMVYQQMSGFTRGEE